MESTCCSIVSNVLTTFSGRSTFCTFAWTSLDRKYFPLLDSFTSSGRDTTTGWSGILSESLLPPPPPNKQASKQEENKTHGKSNDVQGIHLFEPIFKTTQLSLSLSLSRCLFFLFRRLPADFADGVRPPLELECSKVRFRRFLRHLVELTIQCVNNECIRSILRLHKRATQVMGQIMLPKQIY